jgi:phage FluMu protein Com
MTEVRCPRCGRLLGYFTGQGVIQCTRCRKGVEVEFDTTKDIVKIRAS